MNFLDRPGRRLLAACALLLAVAALAALAARRPRPATAPVDAVVPEIRVESPQPPEERLQVQHASIGRGGTLAGGLDRLGIAAELRQPLVVALAEQVDPRRLPSATGLAAARDPRGRLVSVTLRHQLRSFVRVRFDDPPDTAMTAELHQLPLSPRIESAGGLVTHSVAQALAESPHAARLTSAFADIFQWDVDLLVDPRPGDAVCVIYEVLQRGDLPPDLPRFDKRPDRPGDVLEMGRILAASYHGARAGATAYWVAGASGGPDGGNYFDGTGTPLRKAFLKSPLNYTRISSRFSNARRHPVTRQVIPHHGVDFAAAPGTPVVATADGRVISAGWSGALGRTVRLRHGSEYTTVYGHLQSYARGVRSGAQVRQNQVIGYVGSSGRATGPHVHYTVQHSGRAIDPLRMKNPPVEPLDPAARPDLDAAVRSFGHRLEDLRRSLAAVTAGHSGDPSDETRSGT